MGMLHTASRDIKHRKDEIIFREQQRNPRGGRAPRNGNDQLGLTQDQNKVKQLMDRFDSLIAEGRQQLAEEAAVEAQKIVDRSLPSAQPTLRIAAHDVRFLGNDDEITAVRVAKQKGFVDATFQTEASHVPTTDDPPIVYQDAEVWKELTARRREKFGGTELSRRSPTEKKIEEALKRPTQIEFVETPLKDVVEYLKDLHHIEIQLDSAALKEAGVDESTPVTKNLKGISLRSALKLLLGELQLKYVIHNEVLLITSAAKAESGEYMTTKVYPMADVVLPIKESGFTGGFGNIGGRGNSTMDGGNPMGNNNMNPMGNNNLLGNRNPMGNGNPLGNGNGNGNGNIFGGGNPMGNGVFNIPREILPRGN